jgi:hypothetical protein
MRGPKNETDDAVTPAEFGIYCTCEGVTTVSLLLAVQSVA